MDFSLTQVHVGERESETGTFFGGAIGIRSGTLSLRNTDFRRNAVVKETSS